MKMKFLAAFVAAVLLLTAWTPFVLADGAIELTFWHSMSEEAGEALAACVQRFNDTVGAEQGIRVTMVYQGQYADSVTKMNSLLNAGDTEHLPDVMQLDATGKVVYSAAEQAYTIDRLKEEDPDADLSDYQPSALQNWNLNGMQLGVPFATSTTVTFYNKTVLDALGLSAPDTLQDIGAIASAAGAADYTVYACIPNTPTLANWLGQLGSYLVNYENGTVGTADRLDCIENGALESFLRAWKDLFATGALANTDASSDEFAAGKLLVMTSSSSKVAGLLSRLEGRFELGVCAYPRVNDQASAGATVSGSCLVMFDHGSDRRQAAWKLVRYLTGTEVQAEFAMKTGYIPSCVSAVESGAWQDFVRENPQYAAAAEQLGSTPPSMRSVTVGPSADFYYCIINDISEMLDQDLSAAECAEIMDEDLTGMLEQYIKNNR